MKVWATGLIMFAILIVTLSVNFAISFSAVGFGALSDPTASLTISPSFFLISMIGTFLSALIYAFYASYTNALYLDLVQTRERAFDSQAIADIFS